MLPRSTDSFGWELPIFVGATVGYSHTFDFDSGDDTDKPGAWNAGITVGAFVPLFDFN